MTAPVEPYMLSAAGNLVCARGDGRQLRDLATMPGATLWPGPPRFVSVPATREAVLACEAIGSPGWCSEGYLALRAAVCAPTPEARALWEAWGPRTARPLLPHQEEFCIWGVGQSRMFNASDRGTGKTMTGWALSKAWRARRILIVCFKAAMGEWDGDQRKSLLLEDRRPVVKMDDGMTVAQRRDVIAALSDLPGEVALVVNYEVLADLKDVILRAFRPDEAVYDESWRLKSPTAKVTKAAISIADGCGRLLLMSGSVIGNHCGDLWSHARMMSQFRTSGMESYPEWEARYCRIVSIELANGRQVPKHVGCLNPAGLVRRLSPHYFRVSKASCSRLPPPSHEYVRGTLQSEVRELYERVEQLGEAAFGDSLSLAGERTTKLRLQQITGGFAVPPAADVAAGVRPRELPSWKLDWLLDFAVRELAPAPHVRAIVWCKFNMEVRRIRVALQGLLGEHRVAEVTGPTPNAAIDAFKASFNSRSEDGFQVGVFQVAKMCSSHNLPAGDHHVLFSHPWSWIMYEQALDRSVRIDRDSDEGVRYWHLVTERSVDEEVVATLARKESMSEAASPETASFRLMEGL